MTGAHEKMMAQTLTSQTRNSSLIAEKSIIGVLIILWNSAANE